MLSEVKILLKQEVVGCALNSHGNCIVDRLKLWKNHGIVFLNFCGNPVTGQFCPQHDTQLLDVDNHIVPVL